MKSALSLLHRAGRRRQDANVRRSSVETALRTYYGDTCIQRDRDAETRIRKRVARELAVVGQAGDRQTRPFHLKVLMGPHIAAVVCAGAAIVAVGLQFNVGGGTGPAQRSPTSAPINGHRAVVNGTVQFVAENAFAGNVALRL